MARWRRYCEVVLLCFLTEKRKREWVEEGRWRRRGWERGLGFGGIKREEGASGGGPRWWFAWSWAEGKRWSRLLSCLMEKKNWRGGSPSLKGYGPPGERRKRGSWAREREAWPAVEGREMAAWLRLGFYFKRKINMRV
jgi:hypothetical protein